MSLSGNYLQEIPRGDYLKKSRDPTGCNCSSAVQAIHFPQIQGTDFGHFLSRVRRYVASRIALVNSNIIKGYQYVGKFGTENGGELYNPHPVYCIKNGYIIVRLLHGLGDQMYATFQFVNLSNYLKNPFQDVIF